MNTFYAVLAAVGGTMLLVYLVRQGLGLRRDAERKRSRQGFLERERERDRRACLAAATALDSGTAPRDAFANPAGSTRRADGAAAPPGARASAESRRRAATSTAFDPDLPGA